MKLVFVSSGLTLLASTALAGPPKVPNSAEAPGPQIPQHDHNNHPKWTHEPEDFMKPFFEHNGAFGTGLGRDESDPHYWASHSMVPNMPNVDGFMGSHGVYRHFTVMEQTAVMIGEPKHGVWRMQEAGLIREYISKDATNCWKEEYGDPNEVSDSGAEFDIIKDNYRAY